ncbi:transcriptional regulator GcvA [Paralimibaculum aggregatum]|uniref:Transcriptional regulator GcvA n=1 Tax=Paralimibaculum aggregatum TaxID=3036245 RepID=A0ABQ6LSU6_9RHOB|nr:LysR substrate-binding domain-containing protein [Limibaculum sp. NKW23]GMG85155.1 transcriptional regulator GcvA [Limibaculum sp. NKW23]
MDSPSPALPSLNALRAFEAAGRHLNFRVAAEELGVTQGAVAQHVRGLEAALGLRLFDRLARGLALTDAGARYHREIARAFRVIAEATGALRPGATRLTISVTPTFAAKWLIPHLGAFAEAHPAISLAVLASERVTRFGPDGVDIAVRQGRPPFGASLRADLLFRQELVAVCNPVLLARLPRPVTAEGLAGLGLLHGAHQNWPAYLEGAFGHVPAAGQEMRFSQTALALDAAIAGQGVALASHFLVAGELARGTLVEAHPYRLAGPADFYVLSPREHRAPDTVDAVRRWLLGHRDTGG